MKRMTRHIFGALCAALLIAEPVLSQTVRSLGYNTSNNAVIWTNTNGITFPQRIRLTNQFDSWFDASVRTNWANDESKYAGRIRGMASNGSLAFGLLAGTPFTRSPFGIIFHAVSEADGDDPFNEDAFQSRFIVRSDGKVGINISAPTHRLHVAGTTRISGDLLIDSPSTIKDPTLTNAANWGTNQNWGPRAFLDDTKVRSLDVRYNTTMSGKLSINAPDEVEEAQLNVVAGQVGSSRYYAGRFVNNQTQNARGVMVSLPNGTNNQGSLTNENTILHLLSGSADYTLADPDDSLAQDGIDTGDEYWYNPNSRFIVRGDGKVGIGTEFPTAQLTLTGDLRAPNINSDFQYTHHIYGKAETGTTFRMVNFLNGTINNFSWIGLSSSGRSIDFGSGAISGFSRTNFGFSANLDSLWTNTSITGARAALLPSYSGNANRVLTVNAGETGVVWTTPASGGTSLPSFSGNAGKYLAVNSSENAALWTNLPTVSFSNTTGEVSVGRLLISGITSTNRPWVGYLTSIGPNPVFSGFSWDGLYSGDLTYHHHATAVSDTPSIRVSTSGIALSTPVSFSASAAATTRTNLGLGATNDLSFRRVTVNGNTSATNDVAVSFGSASTGFFSGGISSGRPSLAYNGNRVWVADDTLYRLFVPIEFQTTAALNTTLTNLGLSGGLTTNVSVLRPGNVTNTLRFTNGILTGVTVP